MNFPAIGHGDVPGAMFRSHSPLPIRSLAVSSHPTAVDELAEDLVRQLAERARAQRLMHELQRIRGRLLI